MANQSSYALLIQKLDQFIRKYYINKLIRGALYSTGFILLLFLLVDLVLYYNDLGTEPRTIIFFSFLGTSLAAIGYWIVLPLSKYFRLGSVISHEQAAHIIGDHFGNVKDKLLNVLQLKAQTETESNQSLVLASIDQKSDEIKLVPFKSAINLSHNKKYLRYALPPLLLLLILLFAAPSLIKDGTKRLVNYGVEFIKPAPFKFILNTNDLSVIQYGDFNLEVTIEGEEFPNEVFIDLDKVQYRLKKEANNRFTYRFNNVQSDIDFSLFATEVKSRKYNLKVLEKPNVVGFEVKLDFPAYTGKKDETLNSVGDLVVPIGTTVDWVFNAENTDNIEISFVREASANPTKRFSDDLFTYRKRAMQDDTYKLFVSNEELPNADSISYGISVIPDLYPEINVEKLQDSLDSKLMYFIGETSDDYGLKSLSFNYRVNQNNGSREGELIKTPLFDPQARQATYDHIFDLNELELKPGDEVSYYFEVFDNDAVNGSKSARTNVMVYAMPTLEAFEAMAEANDEQIKNSLEKALEESKKIQDEMQKLREKLLQEKEMDWQSRKEMEKLLERQKELEKQMEQAKESFQENKKNQSQFEKPNEDVQQKQEQLEKMFDEAVDPEMQELMQQIEQMMQEMEKEDAMEMLEKMEMNDEEMQMDMERLLELFKQLELEQEMAKTMEKLQELAEKQEELAEETEKETNKEETDKKDGEEKDGEKKDGEEKDGEKKDGEEKDGEEKDGEKKDGEEKDGEKKDGEEKDGEKKDGEEKDGEKKDGEEKDGEKKDGEEKDGEKKDGEEKDGEQKDGEEKKPESKQEELIEKQEEINKEFEKIQEQMDKMQEKNEELENKQEMGDQKEEMEDIQRDMKDSKMQLQQQKNKKASESQKNAAQKMKKMSQQMSQQMQSGQMQQMQEDMESLRQLLENLVGLSFDQEDLIDNFEAAEINTPKYVELVQDQFKLKDDFRLVEDSLRALSKRVFQIESFVLEKVAAVKNNMGSSLSDLEERRKFQAADHQQRTMKNVNDLALMLSETMNQMQQQMSAMMSGSQKSSGKPQEGQGQEPQDKISEGQQQLNQQMQQQKQGKGQESGGPGGTSSEEFAKMAARQAALRRAMQEKQKELQGQGKGSKEIQDIINEMDKVETELVNKQLTNQMMKRQQQILTRLLEHEQAERQREFDNQRKSESAQEAPRQIPPSLEEYIKKRKAELEMYKTVSPSLKPYYKNLVEEYFKNLKGTSGTSNN